MVPTCEVVSAAIEAIAVVGTGPLQVDAVTTAIDPVVDLTVTVVIDVITDFIRRLSDLTTVGGYATITGQLTFSSTGAETTIGRHRDKVFVGVSVTVVVDIVADLCGTGIREFLCVIAIKIVHDISSGLFTLDNLNIRTIAVSIQIQIPLRVWCKFWIKIITIAAI